MFRFLALSLFATLALSFLVHAQDLHPINSLAKGLFVLIVVPLQQTLAESVVQTLKWENGIDQNSLPYHKCLCHLQHNDNKRSMGHVLPLILHLKLTSAPECPGISCFLS